MHFLNKIANIIILSTQNDDHIYFKIFKHLKIIKIISIILFYIILSI